MTLVANMHEGVDASYDVTRYFFISNLEFRSDIKLLIFKPKHRSKVA